MTLIYDLPGRGGVFTRAGGGGVSPGGGGGIVPGGRGGVYPGWWGDGLPEEGVYKFCLK